MSESAHVQCSSEIAALKKVHAALTFNGVIVWHQRNSHTLGLPARSDYLPLTRAGDGASPSLASLTVTFISVGSCQDAASRVNVLFLSTDFFFFWLLAFEGSSLTTPKAEGVDSSSRRPFQRTTVTVMFQEPNLVIAIPTFIGSLASFIATTVVIVLHIFIPPKRHFRHALILSLLIAGQSAHIE